MKINNIVREIISGKGVAALSPMFITGIYREVITAAHKSHVTDYAITTYQREILNSDRRARDTMSATAGVYREFLYKTPDIKLGGAFREAVYTQTVVEKIIAQLPSLTATAIVHSSDWPPADMVFSKLRTPMLRSTAVVKLDYKELPWSFNPNYLTATTTLVGITAPFPVSPVSVPQLGVSVLAPMFNPTVQSMTATSRVAVSALQSLSIKYVPVSATFGYSLAVTSLLASNDKQIPLSMNDTPAVQSSALIKRNDETFPQSPVDTLSVARAVLSRKRVIFPQSPINSIVAASSCLVSAKELFPQSEMDALQVSCHALCALPEWDGVVGVEHTGFSAMSILQQHDPESPQSVSSTKQSISTVLINASYPKPGNLAGANLPALVVDALIKSDQSPIPKSNEIVAQGNVTWLMKTKYPRPEDMIPVSQVAIVPGTYQISLQQNIEEWPLSKVPVKGLGQSTLMSADYLPPEVLFKAGVFTQLTASVVATPAAYPKHGEPTSVLTSPMVAGVVASKAVYPPKDKSTSELIAKGVIGLSASKAVYPSKGSAQSSLNAILTASMVALNDVTFPPKNTALSTLASELVAQTSMRKADGYPPKDVVQSEAQVVQVLSTVCSKSTYPNKDSAASDLVIENLALLLMTRDKDLVGLPVFEVRHRPTVTTNIIYDEK